MQTPFANLARPSSLRINQTSAHKLPPLPRRTLYSLVVICWTRAHHFLFPADCKQAFFHCKQAFFHYKQAFFYCKQAFFYCKQAFFYCKQVCKHYLISSALLDSESISLPCMFINQKVRNQGPKVAVSPGGFKIHLFFTFANGKVLMECRSVITM